MALIELLAVGAGLVGLLYGLELGSRTAGFFGALLLGPIGAVVGFYLGLAIQLAIASFLTRRSERKR